MKTINRLKLTDSEHKFLTKKFDDGAVLFKKLALYGSGHPQLPNIFFLYGSEAERKEFWQEHETTHAMFIEFESIEEMAMYNDRYYFVNKGQQIDGFSIYSYQ